MSVVSPAGRRPILGPLIAVLICTGCLAPFVNKAFTIDDPLFLWAAQHIRQHPLDPYGFDVNWYLYPMRMADVTKNPPLACYFLALAGRLFGWSETALHAAFLLPAAGAAWGTYRLAKGLCSRPLLATLAGVLTPVFLVSSTNVMCDTMMLCFWVWSLVCWRRGLERPGWLIVAGVLISLCALTKYFGVSLIPLLFVYTLLRSREGANIQARSAGDGSEHARRRRFGLVALLIPVAVLAAYQLLTQWMYDRGLLLDAIGFSVGAHGEYGSGWLTPLIGLVFTGGCVASVLFYLPLLWPRTPLLAVLALAAALLTPLLARPLVAEETRQVSRWLQAAFFLLGGLSVVALAAADWLRRRDADAWLLFLWTAGTLTFGMGVNWVINGRSLLPLAPAVGILIARRLSPRHSARDYMPLVPAAVVALVVAAADYRQADADRDAARRIADACSGQPEKLWFEGHWGFQYYLQQLGGTALDQREEYLRFHNGDFLALPGNNSGVLYEPPAEAAREILRIEQPLSPLAATMNEQHGAGFYSHVAGPLPFVFAPAAPVRYRVLRFLTAVDAADSDKTRETER